MNQNQKDVATRAVVGDYTGAINSAFGLSKKVMKNDAAGWGSGYTSVNSDQYKNYNDMLDWMNANPQNTQVNQYSGDSKSGQLAVKKSSLTRGTKTKTTNQYGLGYGSNSDALNNYARYLVGGGNLNAADYRGQMQERYKANYMNNAGLYYDTGAASNKYDASNTEGKMYGYINPYQTSLESTATAQNEKAYNEAAEKIKAQHSYGYLSDTGYDAAMSELNKSKGDSYSAMSGAGQAKIDNWTQALSDYFNSGAGAIGDYGWLNGSLDNDLHWLNALSNADSYNKTQMNQQSLINAIYNANLYDPYQYIATGAGEQGQYNPLADLVPTGKRKQADVYNINEV